MALKICLLCLKVLPLEWGRQFKKPVLITENGTCEDDDEMRWKFIADHLRQLDKALKAQIPVIGYLYWSLLDNFEWHHGFRHCFGLIGVDYKTFQRTVRSSGLRFKEVIISGRI